MCSWDGDNGQCVEGTISKQNGSSSCGHGPQNLPEVSRAVSKVSMEDLWCAQSLTLLSRESGLEVWVRPTTMQEGTSEQTEGSIADLPHKPTNQEELPGSGPWT